MSDLYSYAQGGGYSIYRLADAAENGMPQGLINGFIDIACDAYAGSQFDGGEYDYMATAYVLERSFEETRQYGPLTLTSWSQVAPYNSSVPGNKVLGCVTVATAQYMYFKKKPQIYETDNSVFCPWSSMPYSSSNATLSTFLADLRNRLDIADDGGGSVFDIVPLLNTDFGYNVKINDFRMNYLDYTLRTGSIAILRGVTSGNVGHVWICDGLRYDSYTGTEYNLFVLNHLEYPDFDYICIETESDNIYTTTPYCHMNWGWGGNHDGWFLGENWNSGNGNFLREKKIIY